MNLEMGRNYQNQAKRKGPGARDERENKEKKKSKKKGIHPKLLVIYR